MENRFVRIPHPRGHKVVIGACRRDKQDVQDRPYEPTLHDGLPSFVDLRSHLTEVEDQGDLGSCTANAIAGAFEYLEKRLTGEGGDVSRLFIYYLERKLEGTLQEDAGACLRTGMKALRKFGACREATWPYDAAALTAEPPEAAFAEAKAHVIEEYLRVPVKLHSMRACLAEGYPFVFGTALFSTFEEDGAHGRIRMPPPGEKNQGLHAMLACGYSDRNQVFLVRNSWGNIWGDKGYCYFPYAYLTNPEWTADCWTLRRAHNVDFTHKAGEDFSFF